MRGWALLSFPMEEDRGQQTSSFSPALLRKIQAMITDTRHVSPLAVPDFLAASVSFDGLPAPRRQPRRFYRASHK
jgi:hypothetical protein